MDNLRYIAYIEQITALYIIDDFLTSLDSLKTDKIKNWSILFLSKYKNIVDYIYNKICNSIVLDINLFSSDIESFISDISSIPDIDPSLLSYDYDFISELINEIFVALSVKWISECPNSTQIINNYQFEQLKNCENCR
jgi:hypothetical protein